MAYELEFCNQNVDAYRAGAKSVYVDAVVFASLGGLIDTSLPREHWAAWFAARRTAAAFLREAKDMHLTSVQQARFLRLAQVVAYD